MFDMDNHERIMELIEKKHADSYVIPIYIQMYRDQYEITELKEMNAFNIAGMRVGFGARMSIFDKHSFPSDKLFSYEVETIFSHFNEDKNTDEKFVVFSIANDAIIQNNDQQPHVVQHHDKLHAESFYNESNPTYAKIDEQVSYYFNMLKEYLKKQYESNRKKVIEEQMTMNSIPPKSES